MAINETLQQELIKDLLLESHEGLDRCDRELLALEQGQSGSDSRNNIFRVIHTLKNTAGCLGLGHIEHTPHVGKDLLSLLREGQHRNLQEYHQRLDRREAYDGARQQYPLRRAGTRETLRPPQDDRRRSQYQTLADDPSNPTDRTDPTDPDHRPKK